MIKYLFIIGSLIASKTAIAQQSFKPAANQFAKMSQVLPPSPDAAAISKYGGIDIELSTGATNHTINLKSIQDKKIQIPFALQYSSNGIKVDVYPSRVGMGWSFHGGGLISRVVRGRDDLTSTRNVPSFAITPNEYDNNLTDFAWKTTDQGKDTEPDLFSFNFAGYSGDFVFDNSGIITPLNATALRIEYIPTGSEERFKITTTEGIIYYFGKGNAIEQTKFGSGLYSQYVTNVWYLYKIAHPTGYFTTLTYTSETLQNYMVAKDETDYALAPTASTAICEHWGNCVDGIVLDNYEEIYMSSKVARLSEIVTSSGARVAFSYTSSYHPDRLLSSITYLDENNAQVMKYRLSYNSTSNGAIPFLTFLKEYDVNDVLLHNGHEFTYDNMNSMPARLSLSQDHWGYYNGKSNYTLIVKPEDEEIAMKFPNAQANREMDATYAIRGLLTSIKYPTGGKDVIEYEPNKANIYKDINGYLETSGSVTAPSNTWVYSSPVTVTIGYDTKVKISANCSISGGGTVPLQYSGMIEITKVGTTLTRTYVPNSGSSTEFVYLPSGTYTFKTGAKGDNVSMTCTLKYRDGASPNMQDVETNMGGMRVKKVKTYENDAATPILKRYYYGTLSNLNSTSANYGQIPQYLTDYPYTSILMDGSCGNIQSMTHDHLALHWAPLNNIYLQDGKLLKYSSVIESFGGDNFENGVIEHKFQFVPDGAAQNIRGIPNYQCPLSNFSNSSLGETETHVYKKAGLNLVPVSSIIRSITLDSRKYKSITALNINRAGMPCVTFSGGVISGPDPYIHKEVIVQRYNVTAVWKYLSQEVNKQYDENGLNPVVKSTNYFYEDVDHLQLTKVEATDGEGRLVTTKLKYPKDYSAPGNVYEKMVAANVLPIINQKETKTSSLAPVAEVKTIYWEPNSKNFVPSQIEKSTQGSAFVIEGIFNNYDNEGNLLQYTDRTGVVNAIIWGYGKLYPVAKITGSTYAAAIAYLTGGNITALQTMDGDVLRTELHKIRTGLPNAYVTTFTYKHQAGITSITDPNNKRSTYLYDSFNRLILVRDQDGNIVKRICYNYQGQVENCTIPSCDYTAPIWQNTATPLRCEIVSCAYTGNQLQEQQDVNPCSSSYNTKQWVNAGYNSSACTGTPATITYDAIYSGYTVEYTSTTSGAMYSFNLNVPPYLGTLGCVPIDTYTIRIYRTTGTPIATTFMVGSNMISGTEATFNNINIRFGNRDIFIGNPL